MTKDEQKSQREDAQRDLAQAMKSLARAERRFLVLHPRSLFAIEARQVQDRLKELMESNAQVLESQ